MDKYESPPLFRLDGAQRLAVAMEVWRKWRFERYGSILLFGFSGVGKSEGLVRPLQNWAVDQGIPTVWVDIPKDTVDLDSWLVEAIGEELREAGQVELADAVAGVTSLVAAVRLLLGAGALVIVDEFQRVLEADGRPSVSMAGVLERLSRRSADSGCLLLVCNRQVDWSWTEQFHVAELRPPYDDDDAARIVLQQLNPEEAATKFPVDRRPEVLHRLGHNPRVLRLVGLLLTARVLEELLPPAQTDLDEPVDMRLIEDIERVLLTKAAEGLPKATRTFLRDLSVIRDWATWDLIEAMSPPQSDVRTLVQEAREWYLVQARGSTDRSPDGPASRYQVHPLLREVDSVRLLQDEPAWRAAHRRAGDWYARRLRTAGAVAVRDRTLLLGLDGAWYHFTAAGADGELLAVIEPAQRYINRNYGWSAISPKTAGERDARIALLETYNAHWPTAATLYQLGALLRARRGPGDLERALRYAQRATAGQTASIPWALWMRLVREVNGPEAAITAAREATAHVAPEQNLFSVYQLLGIVLNEIGRTEEAVTALREGVGRARGSEDRLATLAICFAAAQPTDDLLDELCNWLSSMPELEPKYYQARALLLERRNQWSDALDVILDGRRQNPRYLGLADHQALCHLALGDASAAYEVIDRFPGIRAEQHDVSMWCAAFAALELGRTARAGELLGVYLGEEAPTTPEQIRERLLHEWDMTVGFTGSLVLSLYLPVLPPAITGLPTVAIRRQYGGPVLPQHQPVVPAAAPNRPHVLALATAWSPTTGGVNSLNRRLCAGLAATARVTCVVLEASDEERREAADAGVTLVEAEHAPGASDTERLSYPPPLADGVCPDVIIGHGRWTGRAARRLSLDYPQAKRVHVLHVIPDDIERHKPKEGVDAAALAEERQEIDLALSAEASHAVAVGPRIYRWFRWDLDRRNIDVTKLIRLDPGFDPDDGGHREPPRDRWTVLVIGRMEDHRLKGLDLAARAFNRVRLSRPAGTPPVELLVRGAPPEKSTALEHQMREWAGDPSLPVRVQPYTTRADRLAADLRGASLVLMPSRAEGFGLVASEAIVAGTPVLVSEVSGLGELLQEYEPEEAARIVVPMTGDDERDVAKWSNMIESALRDRDAEFRRVAALRGRLAAKLTWADASTQLLEQVYGIER